jgi:CRP/FNR family cyclic AMP-dependent transcriptional regulator
VPRAKKASETSKAPKVPKAPKARTVDPYVVSLLQDIVEGKTALTFKKGERIFDQGDNADAIFFVESGKVKISVVSSAGKEAIVAVLNSPGFFGEGSLVGQSRRVSTATAIEAATVVRIEKKAMACALRDQAQLSEKFTAALLVRNLDLEEDLCDQLFNHSERRLARVLLKLARMREHEAMTDTRIRLVNHETLAEMVGTTRSRITHFMNKFRTMGLIDYDNDGFTVRTELLTDIVLRD